MKRGAKALTTAASRTTSTATIGQSKGAFATGEKPQSIEGESTVEGDVDNDSTRTDGVPQGERGRTNA